MSGDRLVQGIQGPGNMVLLLQLVPESFIRSPLDSPFQRVVSPAHLVQVFEALDLVERIKGEVDRLLLLFLPMNLFNLMYKHLVPLLLSCILELQTQSTLLLANPPL